MLAHLMNIKRKVGPKIAISENVTTGNVNQRVVEVMQETMDSRDARIEKQGVKTTADRSRSSHIFIYTLLPCVYSSQKAQVLSHLSKVIFTEPADIGFTCVARRRAFTVMVDRAKGRFIADPGAVYRALCEGLGERHLTVGELTALGTDADLQKELAQSGKTLESYPANLFSAWESANVAKYNELLQKSEDMPMNQAFCTNQNPDKCCKMSSGGVLPAFTKTDKHIWVQGRMRHLLQAEKFAGHGYGVNEELASLLRTPVACLLLLMYIYIHTHIYIY
jgi:hypothetical protein